MVIHSFIPSDHSGLNTGAGGTSSTVMAVQLVPPVQPLLLTVTHTSPLLLPAVTVMEFVPCPLSITNPDGTVQV